MLLADELTVYTVADLYTQINTNKYTGDITLQLVNDISWDKNITVNAGTYLTILGDLAEGEALNGYDESYSSIGGAAANTPLSIISTEFFISNAVFNELTYENNPFYFENSIVAITNSIFNAVSYPMTGSGAGVLRNLGSSAELTIDGSYFSNNTAYVMGGVLCNERYATCNISNSIFTNNTIKDNNGGTYSAEGGGAISNYYCSTLNISSTLFSENSSIYEGGSITNYYYSTLDINGSTFSGNSSYHELSDYKTLDYNSLHKYYGGGAIASYHSSTSLEDTQFNNNTSLSFGGAIANFCFSDLSITNCSFDGNVAATEGGAIDNYYGSTMSIYSSSFSNNKAARGGAINSFYSDTYIYDSTFMGNTASDCGGAIYNEGYPLYIYAQKADTIFSGNTANGVSNAITQVGIDSETYLYASSDIEGEGRVVFNDAIAGEGYLFINTDSAYQGSVVLNADMSGFTGTVVIDNGTIVIGAYMLSSCSSISSFSSNSSVKAYTNFFSGQVTFGDSEAGSTVLLDASNDVLDCFNTSEWITDGTLDVCIDVSIDSLSADFFDLTGDSLDVNISELNILDEALVTEIKIAVADANEGFSLSADQYEIVTDNYTYTITDEYIEGTYYLIMSSTENIPEPSTATLSLLALAALCARRKRKRDA